MNAIIVGANGRPSMIEMLKLHNFSQAVTVFTYRHTRKNTTFWQSITPNKGEVDVKKISSLPVFSKADKILMWGTRIKLATNGAIVYNAPEFSNNASNKRIARELFEKNEIASPKLVKLSDIHLAKFPLIVRRERHRAGIDFNVANSDTELLTAVRKYKENDY